MKKSIFTVALLLFSLMVFGCGLKDRRADKIRSQNPQWDAATVQLVAERKVVLGMTKPMVVAGLGNPDSIKQEGEEEKWTYGINRERDMGAIVRKPVFWVFFSGDKVARMEGDWKKLGYGFYGL
jgi:outer membrane protein assembly factor BamE (lipoprotein component of BamABCDE complex)